MEREGHLLGMERAEWVHLSPLFDSPFESVEMITISPRPRQARNFYFRICTWKIENLHVRRGQEHLTPTRPKNTSRPESYFAWIPHQRLNTSPRMPPAFVRKNLGTQLTYARNFLLLNVLNTLFRLHWLSYPDKRSTKSALGSASDQCMKSGV